jgi:cysteine desulfurase/selenocysteine lyase
LEYAVSIKYFPFFSHNAIRYLDNAATTHKPQSVIDAVSHFYSHENASVHRGIYTLAEHATAHFERVRTQVAHFIGAKAHEIVVTKGATESINMIAQSWAAHNLVEGDEIVITELEHHANYLPWQRLAQTHNLILTIVPAMARGMSIDALKRAITQKTKLVAVTHCSHVLGCYLDIADIVSAAHAVGARVLVDAAQSVGHKKIDVQQLGCDFLVFSGHKMLAPTGVGIAYITEAVHSQLFPYQLGGGMVGAVEKDTTTYRPMPYMLEAGTPPIASVMGLGAAIEFINNNVDFDNLHKHEALLCARLIDGLATISGVTIFGDQDQLKQSGHIVSFTVQDIHAHDVAAYLDRFSIAVRAGNHCAQPLHNALGINGSVRVSFYMYNTIEDVDALLAALQKLCA